MILKHPLNPLTNKDAISKYQDRKVYLFHGKYRMWFGNTLWVKTATERVSMTFKQALKLTKHYKPESMVEYHFIDNLGEAGLKIEDFDIEHIYDCPAIVFENELKHHTTR